MTFLWNIQHTETFLSQIYLLFLTWMEVNKMNRLLKLKSRVINLPAKLLLERFPPFKLGDWKLDTDKLFHQQICFNYLLLWLYHDTGQAKYIKYDLKSYLHWFLFELKNPMARMEVWKKFWRRPNFNPNFITSPLITKSLWASPEFNGISCPQPDIHKLKRNRDL